MLTVIAGAGASFDVSEDLPDANKLPLVNDLFASRPEFINALREHPKSAPIVDRMRREIKMNRDFSLEDELARVAKEAIQNRELQRSLLALRFYLKDAIEGTQFSVERLTAGIDNYLTLLRKLSAWRNEMDKTVAIATFNYDTLIEKALEATVGNISLLGGNRLDNYVSDPNWKLFKLHGSTNWSRSAYVANIGFVSPTPDMAIRSAAEIEVSTSRIIDTDPVHVDDEVIFPAISVPTTSKTFFECPPDHRRAFENCIGLTSHLLLVGWKAAEPHVLDILQSRMPAEAPVTVVDSAAGSPTVLRNLGQDFLRTRPVFRFTNGFSEFVSSEIDDWIRMRL